MKKFIGSILVVSIMACSLAACSTDKQKLNAENLPVLTWLVPGDKQADLPLVLDEANKIIGSKIGAKIDLQFIDIGGFTERMNMNLASGSGFDMCFTGYVNPYYLAAKKGGYCELDEFLEKTPALKKAVPDYAWKGAKVDGKIYAVPNVQIMANSVSLIIQKKYADKYNLDIDSIKRAEDIEPFLEKIKNGEPSLYPFDTSWGVATFDSFSKDDKALLKYTVALKQADGSYKVEPMLKHDRYVQYINLLRTWYEKGYIRKDIASIMDDSQERTAGKYAVMVGTYKPGLAAEYLTRTGQEHVVIPVSEPVLGDGNATMTAISKKTKKPLEAIKLIELMNTDKTLYNLISFGIEGKHYSKIAENRIENVSSDKSGYIPNASWKFGNQFNAYLLPGQEDDVWKKTQQLNDRSYKNDLLGFVVNTDEIKNEISQCETVAKIYKVINNGSDTPKTYLDNYIKKMDEAGIEKICETIERQIKEFLLNK